MTSHGREARRGKTNAPSDKPAPATAPTPATAAGQLCVACGMCCDGTLFDLVKLEGDDDARKLKALGLPVKAARGRVPVERFPQPCAALGRDCRCRVYADRPWQCRVFECGVLKELQAGRIPLATALRRVKRARGRAERARELLRALGDRDEHRGLGERFHRTSERMEAGGTDAAARALFADLSLLVHRFKLEAHDRFYTTTAPQAGADAGGGCELRR